MMDKQTYRKLELLARCTFIPGSWNKRFVYALSALPQDAELSDKQAANVDRLYWRYRRQIVAFRKEADPELVEAE